MKKICVLSDSHRQKNYVEKVRYELCPDADLYIHCGDICYEDKSECLDMIVVQGNNDWNLDLPKHLKVEIENISIFIIHGDYLYYMEDEIFDYILDRNHCDLLLMGHTHCAEIRKLPSGRYYCNPGSVCWPQDEFSGSYLTIEVDGKNVKPEIHRFELDESMWQG